MPEKTPTDNPPELKLPDIVDLPPEEVSDDQKVFLEEHKAELTPEQAEKFGIEQEKKPDFVNPEEVVIETRTPKKPEEKPKGEGEEPPEEEEEEEIAPEDERAISKVVKKQLAPILEGQKKVQALENETQVSSFIQTKPEYTKYKAVILKYMAHPDYANIPVHNIAAIVAAKELQEIGAQKEREAQKKAKDTQGGGTTIRKLGEGATDWGKASKEEFEAQKAKVLGQRPT